MQARPAGQRPSGHGLCGGCRARRRGRPAACGRSRSRARAGAGAAAPRAAGAGRPGGPGHQCGRLWRGRGARAAERAPRGLCHHAGRHLGGCRLTRRGAREPLTAVHGGPQAAASCGAASLPYMPARGGPVHGTRACMASTTAVQTGTLGRFGRVRGCAGLNVGDALTACPCVTRSHSCRRLRQGPACVWLSRRTCSSPGASMSLPCTLTPCGLTCRCARSWRSR